MWVGWGTRTRHLKARDAVNDLEEACIVTMDAFNATMDAFNATMDAFNATM